MPDDFLEFPFKRKTNNPLKTAIILIAVGVGVSLFMFLRADCGERLQAVALGIIPFVIGVGYLTYYLISRKQAPAKDE